jgi:hypothetical protein
MAGVQHLQLEPLVGLHVGDQFRARLIPGRVWTGKPVLDHPLGEGLATDTCLIDQSQRGRDATAAHLRGGGDDAIDHGPGKGGVLFDPSREPPFSFSVGSSGERQDGCFELASVAVQVIATDHGYWPAPPVAALGKATNEPADGRARTTGLRQIVDNIQMILIKTAIGTKVIASR